MEDGIATKSPTGKAPILEVASTGRIIFSSNAITRYIAGLNEQQQQHQQQQVLDDDNDDDDDDNDDNDNDDDDDGPNKCGGRKRRLSSSSSISSSSSLLGNSRSDRILVDAWLDWSAQDVELPVCVLFYPILGYIPHPSIHPFVYVVYSSVNYLGGLGTPQSSCVSLWFFYNKEGYRNERQDDTPYAAVVVAREFVVLFCFSKVFLC
jgi:hypothetical protein